MDIKDFANAELGRVDELMKNNTVRALIATRDKYIEELEKKIRTLVILNFISASCLLITIVAFIKFF